MGLDIQRAPSPSVGLPARPDQREQTLRPSVRRPRLRAVAIVATWLLLLLVWGQQHGELVALRREAADAKVG